MSVSSSTSIQFTIWEQFLQFKACKSVEIDAISIEVTQQIKSSSCPTKGNFTAKSGKNAFLAVNETGVLQSNFSELLFKYAYDIYLFKKSKIPILCKK